MDNSQPAPFVREPRPNAPVVHRWKGVTVEEVVSVLSSFVNEDDSDVQSTSVTITWAQGQESKLKDPGELRHTDVTRIKEVSASSHYKDRSSLMCWARPTGLTARESHTFVEEPGADTLAYSRLGLLQVYIEENSPGIPFPRWYHDPALLWQVVLVALAFVVFLAWDRAGIAHFAWGAVPALIIAIGDCCRVW